MTEEKYKIMTNSKKIPVNTVTRDLCNLAEPTKNIYETVVILAKRANQISIAEKKELTRKLRTARSITGWPKKTARRNKVC